jgi:hypothetical protein
MGRYLKLRIQNNVCINKSRHQTDDPKRGSYDLNRPLINMILKSKKETVKNMRSR